MADETSQPVEPAAKPKLPLWLRLLGIKRRSGKRIPIGLSRWGFVLATFIVLVGGSAGFAEYSMQPDFCRSCHLMEPYYQAWHSSTHKNVACTKCHFEPGLEKFPVDDVMFTGRLPEEEFKQERPAEYARLLQEGRLYELRVPPAPRWYRIFAVLMGIIAMAIGTTLVALIILAGLKWI